MKKKIFISKKNQGYAYLRKADATIDHTHTTMYALSYYYNPSYGWK